MPGRGKSRKTMALIDASFGILAEIQPATIRAVCYRLFIAGAITSMVKAETNRVGMSHRLLKFSGGSSDDYAT